MLNMIDTDAVRDGIEGFRGGNRETREMGRLEVNTEMEELRWDSWELRGGKLRDIITLDRGVVEAISSEDCVR